MDLYESNGKKLYKACVKVFNKKGLHEKLTHRGVLFLN